METMLNFFVDMWEAYVHTFYNFPFAFSMLIALQFTFTASHYAQKPAVSVLNIILAWAVMGSIQYYNIFGIITAASMAAVIVINIVLLFTSKN